MSVEKRMLEKIEQLVSEIKYRLADAEVYVTSIEPVEDYDAGFFYLHVEREEFSMSDVEEIRRIIEAMGFAERNVNISVEDGKVKLLFDLRW
jgi:NADPH-dependent 2,4-dienoyl-CoA reductase/sulfur reductase-like enzyme